MRHNKKAFTLVEMLVALAVSSIIIAATFASFELIQKQYKKNIDVAELHTSGRAIMTILEREVRMAGYEFRDGNGLMTYGSITAPIEIKDSGNKCCDEVTIIYDEVFDTLNASGVVTSSTVERVKTRFWTEPYTSTKHGTRNRLFKRRTILGTNNALLGTPRVGAKEVMADYVEDLQLINTSGFANLYATDYQSLHVYDTISRKWLRTIPLGYNPGNQSSITIGSDGLVYALGSANGKWTVFIINPKTGSTSLINSPGRNNRWAPGLGIASDGFLYINTTAGGLVDVYDVKTKQLQQSIMPNQQIKNLLSNTKDTNSSGVTCELPNGSNINCSNSSSLGSPKNTKYSTIKFGNDDIVYAAGPGRRDDIDIYSLSQQKFIGEIKLGLNGQNSSSRSYGLVSESTIKTLSTVDITLTIRSKGKYGKSRQFLKKDYFNGNFNFNKNDQFFRDTFSTTVSVRNL